MNYDNLNSMQLDALKEVTNIGAGNGATVLSQLLNKKIDMSVPSVNIIDFNDFYRGIPEDEIVTGILVRVLGDAPGNILFIFRQEEAENIIEILMGSQQELDGEMANSVLCEIGNIISASYMNAISSLTSLRLMPSVPAVAYDMLSAILTTTFIETAQVSDSVLEIKTMLLGEQSEKIGGDFYYIPMPGSLEKILNSIGVI
ncbi:MAG: chemotaxis protein CheC [Inconstantimicrobium porci]|uniref:Chemotaxis protein CheC n=1 Tax=Inconstantimicrobium porci TaxID=2652291 RepID=A0A7X2T250_9CLOT|nr:chemotaxis protein CheC [Inconstantimicrobium porci]MDD6770422.1 chemotaxis protein CheC [Inconstantimicrobium porci]MDY5913205.1 chemotaxis protein CheC [Inconstantimicrobium porci]MSR91845.1 chemotaxis protein CheC [Inconstantimicrobium porci]